MRKPLHQRYTIRAAVADYPKDCWCDIDILSDQTFGDLGAAVLASFESMAYHLWHIETKDLHLEYGMDPDMVDLVHRDGFRTLDPESVQIGQAALRQGEQLVMMYDYGTTWDFVLTVQSVAPIGPVDRSLYPQIAAGKGARMVDDVSPCTMRGLMDSQKRGEAMSDDSEYYEMLRADDLDWRYDYFDLYGVRHAFQGTVRSILQGYRELRNDVPPFSAFSPLDPFSAPAAQKAAKPRILTFRFEAARYPDKYWWRSRFRRRLPSPVLVRPFSLHSG